MQFMMKEDWDRFLEIRKIINKRLEEMRERKEIGRAEESYFRVRVGRKLVVFCNYNFMKPHLKVGEIFFDWSEEDEEFTIVESRSLKDDSDYAMCPRCQIYHPIWGKLLNYDNLCDRCCGVIMQSHPNHPSAIMVLATKREQEGMLDWLNE